MSESIAAEGHPAGDHSGQRALYLRWRPRFFGEVVGQEAVVRTLRNAVARGSVAHGYLLCGPRGTGKTSLARILYKALNCANPLDGEPCGACASCLASDEGRALDLIEIDAASNRGIDDIRALRERVRFAPAEATWKVYIVDEAHQLTAPAWDAFLKTLEEPPPHTVFVMATTAAHKVPATIVSRCQRFDLGRIPHRALVDHLTHVATLEGIALEAGVADRLARLANGGLRDALGMLEQVAVFAGSPVSLDAARKVLGLVRGDAIRSFIDGLSQGDSRTALEVLEDVAQEGADLHQFLDEVLFDLRAALLIRVGAEAATATEMGAEEREWLRGVAGLWAPSQLAEALERLADAEAGNADERRLLIQLELATALLTDQRSRGEAPMPPPAFPIRERLATEPVELSRVAESSPPPTPQGVSPADQSVDLALDRVTTESRPPESPPAERSDGESVASSQRPIQEPGSSGRTQGAERGSRAMPPMREAPGGPPEDVPASESTPSKPGMEPPALAVVQARWIALLDRFKGNLFAKMLLAKMQPAQIDDGCLRLVGKLAPNDSQRLEAARPLVEALLAEEYGVSLTVKFLDAAQVTDLASDDPQPSIEEYASQLFGGRLIPVEDEP
jgi:DNA polymerase-3 subunit gamma/tau